ncbi:hypothetical protein HCN44_001078 [Aphidius gifuensis]|uniref:GTP-binding protein RAD n=1 Tax=Aphidius gifuensis TaxID=684658 RepID=A0A835CPW2_APHGI|nr:hypothetical protein HCN44_001078 [Aphidius gifuensis]
MVTTTDSEQRDDSLDLIDEPSEMSPPSSKGKPTSPPSVKNEHNNLEVISKNKMTNCNKQSTSPASPGDVTLTSSPVNGSGAPPPTPLIGARHENRFTFGSGRTPALPELKTSDFFSTPVRGSVDAGQPDPQHLNTLLSLIAKETTVEEEVIQNHINVTVVTKKNNNTQSFKRDRKSLKTPTKPSINVTTNPLDISLCNSQSENIAQSSTGARGRGRQPECHSFVSAIHSWVSLLFPFCAIDKIIKLVLKAILILYQQLLTLDEIRLNMYNQELTICNIFFDFEVKAFDTVDHGFLLQGLSHYRYGSPHHSRSQSVKTPGSRSSGRPNYLCLPQQRSRVASMPNTGVEEEYYRLRHFSITGKGIVNRGDSLKSRRSRSNNSVASSNSSTEHLTASYPGSARNSAAGSLASSRESSASQGTVPFRVLMLGAPSVGKSSLVSQFMTSEYLHAYDTSIDDESGEKTVSVLLAEEESELTFIDHPSAEMTPEKCIATYEPHAYCIVYSTTDRSSMRIAEDVLQALWCSDLVSARAVILVGNKVDLVRSRDVATEEGKSMATAYDCKFIETSVGINHNVDELLVGLLTQIRLKLENPERTRDLFRKRSRKNRSRSPLGSCSENNSPKKFRNSRTSASLKVRSLLGKVWARDSKSKSCENLHVL